MNRSRIGIFILASILIHLSIFLLWKNKDINKDWTKKKEPIIVDVIDMPKEKGSKKNESNKLAERSHKTDQETRKKSLPSSGDRLNEEEKRIAKVEPRVLPKFKMPETKEEEIKERKERVKGLDKKPKEGDEIEKKSIEEDRKEKEKKEDLSKESKTEKETLKGKEMPKIKDLLPDVNRFKDSYEKIKEFNPKEGKEDKVVSLNTTEFKYISYFAGIKKKIELVWEYPEIARENGIQGKLFVKFAILKDGSLEYIQLVSSSGFPILDKEAINAVETASPFNPIPGSLETSKLVINASFEYHLSFYYAR